MKLMKRSCLYQASNVTFNPETIRAYSYNWWRFVDVIDGLVVFNDYRYSATTSKHQSKVRGLMEDLGIRIDLFISSPRGLQSLDSALEFYSIEHNLTRQRFLKKRIHAKTKTALNEKLAAIELCETAVRSLIKAQRKVS